MLRNLTGLRICEISHRLFASSAAKSENVVEKLPSRGMRVPPFAFFLKENFPKNSNRSEFSAIQKTISAKWNALPEADKKKYFDFAAEERQKRIDEFLKLPEDERKKKIAESAEARTDLKKRRAKKARRDEWEKTGRPQQPTNAYGLFVKKEYESRRAEGLPLTPLATISKELKAKWDQFSALDKKPFEEASQKLHEEYASALEVWKKKTTDSPTKP